MHLAILGLEAQCGYVLLRGPHPFVQAVVDDIHLAANAPPGPRLAGGEVHHLLVRLVELDVQVGEHGLGEPRHVFHRTLIQLMPRLNAVLLHEALQMAAINIFRRRPPNNLTTEFELCHRVLHTITMNDER